MDTLVRFLIYFSCITIGGLITFLDRYAAKAGIVVDRDWMWGTLPGALLGGAVAYGMTFLIIPREHLTWKLGMKEVEKEKATSQPHVPSSEPSPPRQVAS